MYTARRRRTRCLFTALYVGIATIVLAGCQGGGPEAPFREYLERLGRTLSVAPPPLHATARAVPPRPGSLRRATRAGSLDTLDFLDLSGCAVQVTIGKRNSSLGRLARDSQKLLLDLEYLRLAPDCVAQLHRRGEPALARTLEAAWQLKREQLPVIIFNATLGGEEFRAFWRGTRTPAAYPEVDGTVSLAALERIDLLAQRWLSGDYAADNREFEILLSQVAGGDGGALLKGLLLQRDWLDAADRLLDQRRQRGALCGPQIRHAAADILPRVVQKYFVDGIQPGAARLHGRYHELLPALRSLEQRLGGALPQEYRQWRDRRDARFADAIDAPRRHVQRVQAILDPCNTAPGPAP